MDVKQAVSAAKKWLSDVFENEQIYNIGLEEVEYDEQNSVWLITLGFSRPWNRNSLVTMVNPQAKPDQRSYRVVTIKDTTGKVLSMKRTEEAER